MHLLFGKTARCNCTWKLHTTKNCLAILIEIYLGNLRSLPVCACMIICSCMARPLQECVHIHQEYVSFGCYNTAKKVPWWLSFMVTTHPDIDHLLVGRSCAAVFITQIHAPQDRMPLLGRALAIPYLKHIETRRISSIFKSHRSTESRRGIKLQPPIVALVLLVDCIENQLQIPFCS